MCWHQPYHVDSLSCCLRNPQTYGEPAVTITPGARLNLVLGPNGRVADSDPQQKHHVSEQLIEVTCCLLALSTHVAQSTVPSGFNQSATKCCGLMLGTVEYAQVPANHRWCAPCALDWRAQPRYSSAFCSQALSAVAEVVSAAAAACTATLTSPMHRKCIWCHAPVVF